MLAEEYKIRKVGSLVFVKRIVYPRIMLTICFRNTIAEVMEFKMIDKCSLSLVVPVIDDIEQIISDNDPSKSKKLVSDPGNLKKESHDQHVIKASSGFPSH